MGKGKLFPHIKGKAKYDDKDLGIGVRNDTVVAVKYVDPKKAELIERAKQLHGAVETEVKKVERAMRKNAKKPKNRNNVVELDHQARTEGPARKTFHLKDLKHVDPMTANQRVAFDFWEEGFSLLMTGYAGTGKTFVAINLALESVLDPQQPERKLIIVRSAVPSRDMGFMPGSEEEKMMVFEVPYINIFKELFPFKNSYEDMKEAGLVEFMTTSYLRGLTFNNSVIIVDECQNMTFSEINTIMTRVGKDSSIIFCGDYLQNDLTKRNNDQTGIIDLINIVNSGKIKSMKRIDFIADDIVRSGLVKEWILATSEMGNDLKNSIFTPR